ncbi:MAG: hypothetical protein J7L69_12240 [Desulfobulbaceae bacterium]|nr:hypothetical protein [Desulfobulbaceae bacterium]
MAEISVLTVAPRKGDLPFTPYSHIYLSSHSTDDSGRILMSPQLMNDREIDETINQLIEQLEKVRKKTKKELQKKKLQLHESLQK